MIVEKIFPETYGKWSKSFSCGGHSDTRVVTFSCLSAVSWEKKSVKSRNKGLCLKLKKLTEVNIKAFFEGQNFKTNPYV